MVSILKKVKNIFIKNSKSITIQNKESNTIYWTEKGKHYHTDKNCIALSRSKDILEGTINTCSKDTLCEICKQSKDFK